MDERPPSLVVKKAGLSTSLIPLLILRVTARVCQVNVIIGS